jgi:DNA repair protein RadC
LLIIHRFVSLHLSIEKEQPAAWDIPELLQAWGLHDQPQETLWVIAYDSVQQVRTVIEVAKGDYHEMEVPIAAIISAVVSAGTNRFVIAHNHPSGNVTPTVADVDLTAKVLDAANITGLFFEDHIIVSPSGASFSFVRARMLTPDPELAKLVNSHRPAKQPAQRKTA